MPLVVRTLLVLALLAGCQETPEAPRPAASPIELAFELTDETGSIVDQASFDDPLKLVFFGFTSCPDICPITLQNVGVALRSLDAGASDVTVLFVSVDPRRDTPERLTLYADAFHPSIVGLTGSWEQLTAVTSLFRTTFGHTVADESGGQQPLSQSEYESLPEGAEYSPFHSSQLYIVGANGHLLDIIGYGSPPSTIEAILRKHL